MSSENSYLNDQYKSFFEDSLSKTDPDLHKAINDELKRQQQHIELIASENIVSQAVLEAQGSVLTNKYAEGYPGRRYYNGKKNSTIQSERNNNPRLQVSSKEEYADIMNNLNLPNPKMLDVAVPANLKGLTLEQI